MSEGTEFITIIRPSFMRFCKDACRAATFNHILFRIAGKCKDQPKEKIQSGEVLWYGSNEQITEEMSNAWGLCKVRKETNELINAGLLGRKSNPTWGVDRTKHFFFGTEQCEKFLGLCEEHSICFVHLDIPAEVKHLIYLSNANDKSIKCICSIHQMQVINLSDAFDKSIEAITKEDYKRETTKERENTNVDANAINNAPSPISLSAKKRNEEKPTTPPTTEQSVTPPSPIVSAPPAPDKPAKGAKTPSGLTKEGQHIRELWETCTKRKLSLTPANIKALNGLGEVVESDEDFNDVYKMMKNHGYYKDKKVRIDIDFMFRKFDGWIGEVDEYRREEEKKRLEEERREQMKKEGQKPQLRQFTELERRQREMAAKYMKKAN
jgi:hypothetical protein